MLHSLTVILGISTIFIGSIATAQKVPVELSQLENRSLAEDGELFFPQISQNRSLDYSNNFVGRLSRESSTSDFFGEDIRVEIGDMGTGSTDSPFDPTMMGDRSDETQVLFPVYRW